MCQAPPPEGRLKNQEAHIPKIPIKQGHTAWSQSIIWALDNPTTSPHQNDEKEKSPPQQRKDNESVASATELMDMDMTKLSEMEFRVTMVKMMCRLEKNMNKNINENIESLRPERRANLAEIKNAMNQMQSKLDALTARVNEVEEQISELEDGMVEKREKNGNMAQKNPISRM